MLLSDGGELFSAWPTSKLPARVLHGLSSASSMTSVVSVF